MLYNKNIDKIEECITNVPNSTAQLGASAIKGHTVLTPRRYCDGFVQIVAHPRTSWQEDLASWQEDLARLPELSVKGKYMKVVIPCRGSRRPCRPSQADGSAGPAWPSAPRSPGPGPGCLGQSWSLNQSEHFKLWFSIAVDMQVNN